jgi:hypothetical protein
LPSERLDAQLLGFHLRPQLLKSPALEELLRLRGLAFGSGAIDVLIENFQCVRRFPDLALFTRHPLPDLIGLILDVPEALFCRFQRLTGGIRSGESLLQLRQPLFACAEFLGDDGGPERLGRSGFISLPGCFVPSGDQGIDVGQFLQSGADPGIDLVALGGALVPGRLRFGHLCPGVRQGLLDGSESGGPFGDRVIEEGKLPGSPLHA